MSGHRQTTPSCTIVLLMGVSGCGKSTVGTLLAQRLGWPLQDGDAFHPPANIAKMASGLPLDDADRWPWLAAIAAHIDQWRASGTSGIVICSALKRAYRAILVGDRAEVRLVHLAGTPELIAARLAARRAHFMPPALLASQFATLEPPGADERALVVDVAPPAEVIVRHIVEALALG